MSAAKQAKAARKPSAAEGRRELQDIVRTSRTMEERRLNPFLLDVGRALDTADRYFPYWEQVRDLELDAKALNALSRVVKMQEGRLRYQAHLFHADPEAMAEKLQAFDAKVLARVFLEAWHPVVELEQLTGRALEEALDYWEELPTAEERHRERPRKAPPQPETVTLDDLLARGVLARDGFGTALAELWDDLKRRGPTDYWQFIEAPTYGAKVKRAYGTSYLVSYGYATVQADNGSYVLRPRGEREPPQASVSLPIALVRA